MIQLLVLFVLLFVPPSCAQTCSSTIADLRAAQQAELDLISGGAAPTPPYEFELCADTTFDVGSEGEFVPLLSGVTFSCGNPASSANNCIFSGGDTQVRLQDSSVAGYEIMSVRFQGVTFENFGVTAIAAESSDTTTLSCEDCVFQAFDSATVINQSGPTPPTSVEVINSLVTNGAASSNLFLNIGGSLLVDGTTITGVTAPAFITSTEQTATATIIGSSIVDNTDSSGDYVGIEATQGAFTEVIDTEISRNQGLQIGVQAVDGANVRVRDSTFVGNSAVNPTERQSVVGSYNMGNVTVDGTNFIDNTNYLGIMFAIFESNIQGSNNNITGGQSVLPIFISEFSTGDFSLTRGEGSSNVVCQPPPFYLIVFREDPGFSCFVGTGECFGTCVSAFGPGSMPPSFSGPPVVTGPPGPPVPPGLPTFAPAIPTRAPVRSSSKSRMRTTMMRSTMMKMRMTRRSKRTMRSMKMSSSRSKSSSSSSKSSSSKSLRGGLFYSRSGKGKGKGGMSSSLDSASFKGVIVGQGGSQYSLSSVVGGTGQRRFLESEDETDRHQEVLASEGNMDVSRPRDQRI